MKPVSKTAYYTAGARMIDASCSNTICGDSYAELFINDEGRVILKKFGKNKIKTQNIAHRHRIIDDYLSKQLKTNPNTNIIIIGAGFDSRAFRLDGGIWTEIDEDQIISIKNEKLPISKCRNNLNRISINFETDKLQEKLAPLKTSDHVVVVLEGVLMYLEENAVSKLTNDLQSVFTNHCLICDLMGRRFVEKYGRSIQKNLIELGASFKFLADNSELYFQDHGYLVQQKISPIRHQMEELRVPKFMMQTILSGYLKDYFVYKFEYCPSGRT